MGCLWPQLPSVAGNYYYYYLNKGGRTCLETRGGGEVEKDISEKSKSLRGRLAHAVNIVRFILYLICFSVAGKCVMF